jgi:hypothetical protein
MDDINDALNALVAGGQLAQFSDYVASWTVTTAETGNYINIAMVGEPGQEKAAITVSNERALSILDDLTAGKSDAQEARLYIGTFAGLTVRVKSGVDRAHGESAMQNLQAADTMNVGSYDFSEGGRIAYEADGIIHGIVIVGAPEPGSSTVQHIGGGILEIRLSSEVLFGGIILALQNGWDLITNEPLVFIIMNSKQRVVGA